MCVSVFVCVFTFAGVGGSVRSLGVSEETGLAVLTLVSFSVVQTVTHASAALARLPPRRPIKTAALSVSVTLTLCVGDRSHIVRNLLRNCQSL